MRDRPLFAPSAPHLLSECTRLAPAERLGSELRDLPPPPSLTGLGYGFR